METFDINIAGETYKVTRTSPDNTYSVFNHATFHTIHKNDFGLWRSIEHRFGKEDIPIYEIGDAIEQHHATWQITSAGFAGKLRLI